MVFISTDGLSQPAPESFANNAASVEWKQVETTHFRIIYPAHEASIDSVLASRCERIYKEFSARLGITPPKIQIYYNNRDELVSGTHARDIDDEFSIWIGNPLAGNEIGPPKNIDEHLRSEIAYAFRAYAKRFPNDYLFYLFSRPSKSPWSDGFISYLTTPKETAKDVSFKRNYWQNPDQHKPRRPVTDEWYELMHGRSQIHYFNDAFGTDSLQAIYSNRQSLAGMISYFDFNPAFNGATGIDYDTFEERWREDQKKQFRGLPNTDHTKKDVARPEIFMQDSTHRFIGIAVAGNGRRIANIGLPLDGSAIQQLRISTSGANADDFTTIREGYFQPQIVWNPVKDELAFAQRTFNGKTGGYNYQLYLWDVETNRATKLGTAQNTKLPAFSGTGNHLAYVASSGAHSTLQIQNLHTGSSDGIYRFTEPVTVTHLDYHPTAERLLISYQTGGTYRLGLFDIEVDTFATFSLHTNLPLKAQWGPAGDMIYFHQKKDGVSNIFTAEVSGSTMSAIRPVTDSYIGLELRDIITDSNGAARLLATTSSSIAPSSIKAYKAEPLQATPMDTDSAQAIAFSSSVSAMEARSGFNERSYNAFWNTQWERPFFIPYYISPGDFGLAGYLSLKEPMRIHEFDYYGSVSFTDPIHNSFFYSEYVNNSFRPRIELSFNQFTADAEGFGKSRKVHTTNVLALSALWKLDDSSQNYSDWYAGFTLRHLAFNYFPTASLRYHHPNIFFKNRATQQTDLKFSLSWRSLKPNRHNLIHPSDGTGLRFSATASDEFFVSNVRYARFNLDGYTVLPAVSDHRIFLYANGVMDMGAPAGNDYLSFDDKGDYQLPGEDFTGSINPGVDRFIRGYTTPLLGDRFLFGKFEYRIPFQFNTTKKLFGLIPPARTSLTFFADGGVMGDARIAADQFSTEYRYSAGAEIKRVLSFGGSFKLTYELGLAQPLDKSLSPQPYFNIKSALPF